MKVRLPPGLVAVPSVAAIACGAPNATDADLGSQESALGASMEHVAAFGDNPAGLAMYVHAPASAQAKAPLVVALHGCTQTAAAYAAVGWNELADRYGFYVVYPEQSTANSPLRCFNFGGKYGDASNLTRGKGENASIKSMVDKMKADHAIDPMRVFVTGLSAGGAQAALMLATWPDVFAAGAPIAGVPYACATSYAELNTCIKPGKMLSAKEWGARVRAANPSFARPWPRVSVWQGTGDAVVDPNDLKQLVLQWTDVHGAPSAPSRMDHVDGASHAVYRDTSGTDVVESYEIPGMAHGTPVDPAHGCGTAGPYVLDAHICSSLLIARFFGIADGATAGGAGGAGGAGAAGPGSGGLGASPSGATPSSASASSACPTSSGCRASGGQGGAPAGSLAALALVVAARRRRRSASPTPRSHP